MEKISFVLPLKINANKFGSDLERVRKILLPSFIKFFNLNQIDKFLIIVPSQEHREVLDQLEDFREKLKLSVIPEGKILSLVPGWKTHTFVHRTLGTLKKIDNKINGARLFGYLKLKNNWDNLGGWLKQQMLKIGAAKLINSTYYMTLDADICLIRSADLKTLFPGGKAILKLDPVDTHYDWWVGSARALGIKLKLLKEDFAMGVTPEILSTQIVVRLIDYLISKSRENKYLTVFEYLSDNRSWTEYSLYWLFLLQFYNKEEYYTGQTLSYMFHSNGSVWFREQAPHMQLLRERIDSAFRSNDALFLVIQSVFIPLSEYGEAIEGHLK